MGGGILSQLHGVKCTPVWIRNFSSPLLSWKMFCYECECEHQIRTDQNTKKSLVNMMPILKFEGVMNK